MDQGSPPVQITRRQFLAAQATFGAWLALGWKHHDSLNSVFLPTRMGTPNPTSPICSADLRHLYSPSEAGHWYARSAPVAGLDATLERLAVYRAHLAKWLYENRKLIEMAIQSPEIVYRHLPYRSSVRHYLQMYAIQHPMNQGRYVAVTLSLANLPGQKGSAYHKVVRVFPARFDYFWTQDMQSRRILKEKWIRNA